eukprot:217493_1
MELEETLMLPCCSTQLRYQIKVTMASAKNVNVESWLVEKNLSSLVEQFTQRNITIEELCQFDEKDLRAFGIGFGLDTFDAARFAKYIVKYKQESVQVAQSTTVVDNAISRAVVITADEETLLQKLETRRTQIKSLMDRADSSNTKKVNAQDQEIIEQKFTELIQEIEQKKQLILKEIVDKQKEKQLLIQQHVITLKEHLQNIDQITNDYNQWLIQNAMNRAQRKDKLSTLVTNECDKLLPQIADVMVVYNNRLVTPFLAEICKIVNVGLFYPVISGFAVKQIGTKSVTMGWNACLTKEQLIYVEDDNLNMSHVMMCLECHEVEMKEDDDDMMDDEEEQDHGMHYVDYEVDEEQYEFTFNHLKTKRTYSVTLKCISMHQNTLISKQQQADMNQFKVMQTTFQTAKHQSFIFRSDLQRINITNDGKTTAYEDANNTGGLFNQSICCVLLGNALNAELDDKDRQFKLSFTVDSKADHIGFGFVTTDFTGFEHSDWGMGGQCTFFYSDRDFRGVAPFRNKNSRRLTIASGNTVHMVVNCRELSGKIWVDGQPDEFVETSVPTEFYVAVVLGGRVGSSVTLTECHDICAS